MENKPAIKQWEVQRQQYKFNKYARTLIRIYQWRRYRRYYSEQSAIDATRDFRRSESDIAYKDYPGMGNPENEAKYSHILPSINIYRYRIIKLPEQP